MKHLFLLICLVILSATQAQGQTPQDSIYFWKNGNLLLKRSIKTADVDSLSFKRPVVVVTPISTVTIGTQVWTTKNLDVSTYSDGTARAAARAATAKSLDVSNYTDGTPIPEVQDPTLWANLNTGAWCYYNNDSGNGATYGKLYNWYAVAGIHDTDDNTPNKTLAPAGYHIPTEVEWEELRGFLGGEDGNKMKAPTLWLPFPDVINSNSSGFTGIPGSLRDSNGEFEPTLGQEGFYWSATEAFGGPLSWNLSLSYNSPFTSMNAFGKTFGLSVRCVAD